VIERGETKRGTQRPGFFSVELCLFSVSLCAILHFEFSTASLAAPLNFPLDYSLHRLVLRVGDHLENRNMGALELRFLKLTRTMQGPHGGGWSAWEFSLGGTLADLPGSGDIMPEHIAEAIQYRTLDRQLYLEG
jgi:hypothetical protein